MSDKKRNPSFEHIVKKWEIKHGYIRVKSKENWEKFFSPMIGKSLDITVFGKKVFSRKVDNFGRIYLGRSYMIGLKEGDIVVFSRDPIGNYILKKKK